jgi:hypothetical protein
MKTLGDVKKLIIGTKQAIALIGCSAEWHGEFLRRCGAIGEAVCEEQSITREQGKNLPNKTLLGSKSKALALELESFCDF